VFERSNGKYARGFDSNSLDLERRVGMQQWRILLWVVALGLWAGAIVGGCSSKKEKEEEKEEEEVKAGAISLMNVSAICKGCVMYADAHEQMIPNSLEDIKSFLGGRIMLESPREPENFDGPGYIYVTALGGKKFGQFYPPHEYVIVYENPAFCPDFINVGFLDGHCESMTLPSFRKSLEATYKKLGEPMPDGI